MSATINATYILPFPSLFPVTSHPNLLIRIKQKIFSIGNFIQKELIIFFAKSFQKKIITTKKNIHMKYIIIGGVPEERPQPHVSAATQRKPKSFYSKKVNTSRTLIAACPII